MGAVASSRRRADECCGYSNSSPLKSSSPPSNQPDSRVAKKPRLSFFDTSSRAVSRLCQYPQTKPRPKREVHAPFRARRFGSAARNRLTGIGELVFGDSMGNSLRVRRNYKVAKESILQAVQIPNKEPETDSSFEVIDNVEDQNDGGSVSSWKIDEKKTLEDGVIQASSSEVSHMAELEDAEKLLNSLSLSQDRYPDDVPVHKKLLESASRYKPKLDRLKSDIQLQETLLESYKSLRIEKKPEEKVEQVDSASFREPFVPLDEEEEKAVAKAFANSNRRKVLVSHESSNIEITGEVLQCLRPGAWLNDEVINLYLELLKERENREPKKFLRCHFFNTFFYKKLIGGGNGYTYKSVRRWTTQKKLGYGLIECDKIFVPIHKEVHWCLAVINKKDQKFQYLDSLGGKDSQVLQVLARYYVDEVMDKSRQDIDVTSWEFEYVKDLPAQGNGFDCGVFMIKYIDFYSRGMRLHFSQEHMPYFRLRAAKEILQLRAD